MAAKTEKSTVDGQNAPPVTCHQSDNKRSFYIGAEIADPCRQFFRHHRWFLRNRAVFSCTDFKTPRYTFCMRRVLSAMAVILSLVSALHAQDDERLAGKISCHRAMVEDPQNRPYAKKLWDGYEISLGPARNGTVDGNGALPRFTTAGDT
jgi:hypothetical protein